MFDDLIAELDNLDAHDVQESLLEELEDLCGHPIFRLLCDTCERLYPRDVRGIRIHHHHPEELCP